MRIHALCTSRRGSCVSTCSDLLVLWISRYQIVASITVRLSGGSSISRKVCRGKLQPANYAGTTLSVPGILDVWSAPMHLVSVGLSDGSELPAGIFPAPRRLTKARCFPSRVAESGELLKAGMFSSSGAVGNFDRKSRAQALPHVPTIESFLPSRTRRVARRLVKVAKDIPPSGTHDLAALRKTKRKSFFRKL
jgi:hypothetical protein